MTLGLQIGRQMSIQIFCHHDQQERQTIMSSILTFTTNKLKLFTQVNRSLPKQIIQLLVERPISRMADHVTLTYVTAPNEEVARYLGRNIVEKRLAACVNIVKTVESIYEWKNKIEHDHESMLIIKSHSSKMNDLTEFVEKNHPYDCPEIITVKVDSGSKKYLDWVQECVIKKPPVT